MQQLISELKACSAFGDLQRGQQLHAAAGQTGLDRDVYVASTLISMYAKCGSMLQARRVFDGMPHCTVVSWTALILGYAENGEAQVALDMFALMRSLGCEANARTFVAAFKACKCLALQEEANVLGEKCLNRAKAVHLRARQTGHDRDVFVASSLLNTYAICGSLEDARKVFDGMKVRNVVSWTCIISGYAENGEERLALELYLRMRQEGCLPNSRTFVAILKACTGLALKENGTEVDGKVVKLRCLRKGLAIHCHVSQSGCGSDVFVASSLLEMYAKCGSMVQCRKVFDSMRCQDVVAWTCLMSGYAENGEEELAFELFASMQSMADVATFVAVLKACVSLASKCEMNKVRCLEIGMALHLLATIFGWEVQNRVANTLMGMYAKCGSMRDARKVFENIHSPDAVSWNILLFGYAENGEAEMTVSLFAAMDCKPNSLTFVAVLKGCGILAAKEDGKQLDGKLVKVASLEMSKEMHSRASSSGFNEDVLVASTLVDVYAKCGSLVDALAVFEGIKGRNVVAWNAILLGYVDNGEAQHALDGFARMQREGGCTPDVRTYVVALKACGVTVALELGKKIHIEICSLGMHTEAFVVSSLVDFYGRCGSMRDAQQVFDSTRSSEDLVTWTALIAGYSRTGNTDQVFKLFERMQDGGIQPNAVTFLCVLIACSHAGLVDKGRELFESMLPRYGVHPGIEHYACMIGILGRANELDEAVTMLKSMPFRPDAVTWTTLLGACNVSPVVEALALKCLLELDKT